MLLIFYIWYYLCIFLIKGKNAKGNGHMVGWWAGTQLFTKTAALLNEDMYWLNQLDVQTKHPIEIISKIRGYMRTMLKLQCLTCSQSTCVNRKKYQYLWIVRFKFNNGFKNSDLFGSCSILTAFIASWAKFLSKQSCKKR